MTELRTAHTADLAAAEMAAIRSLMDAAFDRVSDDTFDNALGGVHALILEDGELIGHGSVVQRRLLHAGRALRTGYIEGVAVRADRRRQGHGALLMAALERVVRSAYQLGALGASPDGALPVRLARLAAVARALLRHDTGRHQAHPGLGRHHLRPAGVGPGRRVRRAHLRLAPGLAVVNQAARRRRPRRRPRPGRRPAPDRRPQAASRRPGQARVRPARAR